jgi:hypothetical protein
VGIRTVRAMSLAAPLLAVGGGCCHCDKKAEPPAQDVQGAEWRRGANWFPDQPKPQRVDPERINGGII